MKTTRRSHWKPFAGTAAVLVVGGFGLWLFIGKAHERKEFVGKVDPASGYRCRFTLSADWKPEETWFNFNGTPASERYIITYTSNPIRKWIDAHLLHRPVEAPQWIDVTDGNMKVFAGYYHLGSMYPEPLIHGERTVSRRYFKVDGYPATVSTGVAGPVSSMQLVVHVPDGAMLYSVFGATYHGQSSDRIDQEMEAIISSFHIEKVVPAGGKR